MRLILQCLLALTILVPSTAFAGKSKRELKLEAQKSDSKSDDKDKDKDKSKSPFKDFDEVTEGTERHQGFFDLYTKADKFFMAIPKDDLEQEFLMAFEIAQGINTNRMNTGTMLNWEGNLVQFERHGNKIYLIIVRKGYISNESG